MILNDCSKSCSIQRQLENVKRELGVTIPLPREQLVEKIVTDLHVINSEQRSNEQVPEAPSMYIVFVMYIVSICVISSRITLQQ